MISIDILIQFGILILSLAALIFFADKLIDASAKIAKAFGVSDAIIGLTLLAYGTSLPELAVSSISAFDKHPQLSVSNVIGSNMVNIALIIGVASLIRPALIKEKHFAERDGIIMVLSTLFLISLIYYFSKIGRIAGILLVFFSIIYTYYILRQDKSENKTKKDSNISKPKEIGIILICLLAVLISGNFSVDSAVKVAKEIGVTEWLIGATIVAAGTSLPELAVSITSAKKGLFGMSVGNIIGSNIFNILWIIGFAAALNPLFIEFGLIKGDSLFLIIVTLLFAYHLIKTKISRLDGLIYLSIYIGYVAYLLMAQRIF